MAACIFSRNTKKLFLSVRGFGIKLRYLIYNGQEKQFRHIKIIGP